MFHIVKKRYRGRVSQPSNYVPFGWFFHATDVIWGGSGLVVRQMSSGSRVWIPVPTDHFSLVKPSGQRSPTCCHNTILDSSLFPLVMPNTNTLTLTCSELSREEPGLVMHLVKHFSPIFWNKSTLEMILHQYSVYLGWVVWVMLYVI